VIIHEIASKKIAPPLKGLLTHRLYKLGFSQRRIASILEITQPQVYKYLSRSEESFLEYFEKLGFSRQRVERFAEILIDLLTRGLLENYFVLINSIVHDMAIEYACRSYRLPDTVCREKRFADPYIEYYRVWLNRIVSLPGLYRIIPEVGSNIVYAPFKPESTAGIIGLTGRIMRAGESVGVVGEPFYGGSKHLSRVLLLAVKYDEEKRVAMNISHNIDPKVLASKWSIQYTGPHESTEAFWRSLENALSSKPDVVIDMGGYGLEPVTYIITHSFNELVEILTTILSSRQ